ncbi:MAG: S8 family serine peptidase [Thermodesulfobacteriota bacterium]
MIYVTKGIKITQVVLATFLVMFGMFFCVQNVLAQGDYAPDQLIIKYKEGANSVDVQSRTAHKGKKVKEIPELGLEVLEVAPENLEALEQELSQDPDVEYVEKNYYYEPLAIPNDPLFSSQLYFDVFQAPQAWDLQTGHPDVVIAVVDTGFDVTHEDLIGGKILPGCNTSGIDFDHNNCNPDLTDNNGHGTGVTGTAAADTNNGVGVAGVCWGCSILPIRVYSDAGSAGLDDIVEGILFAVNYALSNPTQKVVLNLSFGRSCTGLAQSEFDALNLAWDSGLLTVAARGNSGNSGVICPDFASNVIAVSGTNLDDTLWISSSWNNVDLAAPALPIYNITPGALIDPPYIPTWGGTSFSSAIVSGVAGLAWSADMTLTNSELDQLLRNTADDLGSTIFFGAGRINANAAVDYVINPPPPTPAPTPPPTPRPFSKIQIIEPESGSFVNIGANTISGKGMPAAQSILYLMLGTDPNGSTPITKGPCAGKTELGIADATRIKRIKSTATNPNFAQFEQTYRINRRYAGSTIYLQVYMHINGNELRPDDRYISDVIPVSVNPLN